MSEVAESSLDDFFAKKDKKKAKAKKFTTSDEIAKKLETGKKPSTDKNVKKEKGSSGSANQHNPGSSPGQEEEWIEVEEKEVDYSGLKIQNLQLGESRDDELMRDRSENEEDGEYGRSRELMSGPWNKNQPTASPTQETVETPPPVVEVPKVVGVVGGVYRPPAFRDGTAQSSANKSSAMKGKNKTAPEISSELHFPTLSSAGPAAKPATSAWKGESDYPRVRESDYPRRSYNQSEDRGYDRR